MTARRQARALTQRVAPAAGGVPPALLVGRCYEVWSVDPQGVRAHFEAMRRHDLARDAWLTAAGVTSVAEGCRLVPHGAAWSIEHLDTSPRTVTRGGEVIRLDTADERLAAAGVAREDLTRLREQALELLALAVKDRPGDAYKADFVSPSVLLTTPGGEGGTPGGTSSVRATTRPGGRRSPLGIAPQLISPTTTPNRKADQ